MNKEIHILGIGHNSIAMIDLAEDCGYQIAGLYHYNHQQDGKRYFDFTIQGCFEDMLAEPSLEGKNFLLSMGDIPIRRKLYERITAKGGYIPTLVHPSASVSSRAELGQGVIIMPQSIVQADTCIGDNTVITIHSSISHSARIGRHCFISGNNLVGAYVTMEDGCWIGQSCLIVSGTVDTIGHDSILGAGSVLRGNMRPSCLYLGNPARLIKRLER